MHWVSIGLGFCAGMTFGYWLKYLIAKPTMRRLWRERREAEEDAELWREVALSGDEPATSNQGGAVPD